MTTTLGVPVTADPAQDDNAILLSQVGERLQSIKINGNQIILSAFDSITLGDKDNSGLAATWNVPRISIFAEDIALMSSFVCNIPTAASIALISAHSITLAADTCLSVAGVPGSTPLPQPSGGSSDSAASDGVAGGSLSLYLEDAEISNPPMILANGGQGGGGMTGNNSTAGGNGKNGGDGGNVNVMVSHPALCWITSLQNIYAETKLDVQLQMLNDLIKDLPTDGTADDVIQELTKGSSCKTSKDINAILEIAADQMQNKADRWQDQLKAQINVLGGLPGPYGVGNPNGKVGTAGSEGTTTITLVGNIGDSQSVPSTPFFFVHPSQCAMVLEKAKIAYLFLDPAKDSASVTSILAQLDRVRVRTAPFVGLDAQSDLAKYIATVEADYGSYNTVANLASINAEATRYITYLKNGLDFFGYAPSYVPLTSLKAITKNAVVPLLKSFQAVEKAYINQYNEITKEEAESENVTEARSQIVTQMGNANVDIPQLLNSIEATGSIIDGYQSIFLQKKKTVLDTLGKFEDKIKGFFNFDWGNFLQSLGQVAFAPQEMWLYLAQGANFAYSGITSITDIQGQPVKKGYLLHELQTLGAKVDGSKEDGLDVDEINEGYDSLDDGTLEPSDKGISLLIAQSDALDSYIDSLYNQFPTDPSLEIAAKAVKAAIQDYIQAVKDRNSKILEYNAAVTLVLQYSQQLADLQTQANALNDDVLKNLSANIPGLSSFISQSYYALRQTILRYMNLAARAYKFWCLEDTNLLSASLTGFEPPAINYQILQQIQDNFWGAISDELGALGNGVEFPKDPNDTGEFVSITGFAVDVFLSTGQLIFNVPVKTKQDVEKPFAHMACVRVTDVQVYLPGVKVAPDNSGKSILAIDITHTGKESLVSQSNEIYTFTHEPRTHTFQYHTDTQEIYEPAQFQITAREDPNGDNNVALIGPYTDWHLNMDLNTPGLDTSAVKEVQVYFRGIAWSYNVLEN